MVSDGFAGSGFAAISTFRALWQMRGGIDVAIAPYDAHFAFLVRLSLALDVVGEQTRLF